MFENFLKKEPASDVDTALDQINKLAAENPKLAAAPAFQEFLDNIDDFENPLGAAEALLAQMEDVADPMTAEELAAMSARVSENKVIHSMDPKDEPRAELN